MFEDTERKFELKRSVCKDLNDLPKWLWEEIIANIQVGLRMNGDIHITADDWRSDVKLDLKQLIQEEINGADDITLRYCLQHVVS